MAPKCILRIWLTLREIRDGLQFAKIPSFPVRIVDGSEVYSPNLTTRRIHFGAIYDTNRKGGNFGELQTISDFSSQKFSECSMVRSACQTFLNPINFEDFCSKKKVFWCSTNVLMVFKCIRAHSGAFWGYFGTLNTRKSCLKFSKIGFGNVCSVHLLVIFRLSKYNVRFRGWSQRSWRKSTAMTYGQRTTVCWKLNIIWCTDACVCNRTQTHLFVLLVNGIYYESMVRFFE